MPRNERVELAVNSLVAAVDKFLGGLKAPLPTAEILEWSKGIDTLRASSKLALAFLTFYAQSDPSWNFQSVPVGIRGQYGDKKLAEELTRRGITWHDRITAFGENLGWKGNVGAINLAKDERFAPHLRRLQAWSQGRRQQAANFLAMRIAETRVLPKAIPSIDQNVLSFARARVLMNQLLGIESSGHVQQLLAASLLFVHRRRLSIEVTTHHPHASDTFDAAAGDIEERHEGRLIRAYEVTARPDWKSRLSVLRERMDHFSLKKYVVLATCVHGDPDLREPADMLRFLEPVGRDIAVVDLHEFCDFMCAELSADELREAVNQCHAYLNTPSICGITKFVNLFSDVVEDWLVK